MTTAQKKIFIVLGIIVGLVLAALLYITVIRDRDLLDSELIAPTSTMRRPNTRSNTPENSTGGVAPRPALPPQDQYLIQLARIFVERMGSFSNQDENAHIADLMPMATARMSRYLETQQKPQSAVYAGQTTRVITAELESKQDAKAVVLLGTQQEINEGQTTRREYLTARVELQRVSPTEWKVDGVYWE